MDALNSVLPYLMSGPIVSAISQFLKKSFDTSGPLTLVVVAAVAVGLNLIGALTGTTTPDVSQFAAESVIDLLTAVGVFSFLKTLGEVATLPDLDPRG